MFTLPPHLSVYEAIQNHPDIVMQIINNELYIDGYIYDALALEVVQYLQKLGNVHRLKSLLAQKYPKTVWMNGKMTEFGYLHHKEYTHPEIIAALKQEGIRRIHTRQGYSGCSLLYLGRGKGITADPHMYKVLQAEGADMLLIQPGFIELEGLPYGFIGGCCGVYEDRVFVHGSLEFHPDGDVIRRYIMDAGYRIETLKGEPLKDIGSMLFWEYWKGNNK